MDRIRLNVTNVLRLVTSMKASREEYQDHFSVQHPYLYLSVKFALHAARILVSGISLLSPAKATFFPTSVNPILPSVNNIVEVFRSLCVKPLDVRQEIVVLTLPVCAVTSSCTNAVGVSGLGGSKLVPEVGDLLLLVVRVLFVLLSRLDCRQQVLVLLV